MQLVATGEEVAPHLVGGDDTVPADPVQDLAVAVGDLDPEWNGHRVRTIPRAGGL